VHRHAGQKSEQTKEWESSSILVANEADILRAIGVPWREPHERVIES